MTTTTTEVRTGAAGAPARPGAVATVTAIVLNWCGVDDTSACLRSLQASDYPGLRILLVDNASPDGSGPALHAAFPEVPYLQTGDNLGYTGGNNRGIERALAEGADYVLVLNNDTLVEPDAVSRLVQAARSRPGVGAVAPKILYADAPDRIWFAGGDLSRSRAVGYHRLDGAPDPDPRGGPVEEVSFLTGCCLLIPAQVIREVGAFEEDFFAYVEDVDLSLRMLEQGLSLLYAPSARIYHRVPLDAPAPSPWQIVQGVRNRRRLARRRLRASERLRFALFFYPTRLVRVLEYLSRGDTARARAVWMGLRGE